MLILALVASVGLTVYCMWAETHPPAPKRADPPTPVIVQMVEETPPDDDDPPTVVQIRRG